VIRRRAVAAGIRTPIGSHSSQATGIAAYLSNGGALEHAQEMAAHESLRTTKLCDRTKARLTQRRSREFGYDCRVWAYTPYGTFTPFV
jgi:hypothetical protein